MINKGLGKKLIDLILKNYVPVQNGFCEPGTGKK
jgi:hypothetical protein